MTALSFNEVSLTYKGHRVLSGVSFNVKAGSFVGILGPNGAGKTTLLRAVLGLIAPERGEVCVLGRVQRRGNPEIGYMPQARRATSHAGLSGLDLVRGAAGGERWGWPLARKSETEAAWHALEQVGATDLARRPLAELSGGERQRIMIAQALIGSPKLLLLDEPLISLDAGHQRAIIELVHRVGADLGIAVLFCSHEINPLLGVLDEVLYLGNGAAAMGRVDEVITPQVLSRLYGAPIDVIHANGRIFVLADNCVVEGEVHTHDHGQEHGHGHAEHHERHSHESF